MTAAKPPVRSGGFVRCAIALTLVLGLGACGGGGGSIDRSAYTKNLSRYALPLDQFGDINYRLSDYALGLLVKPCMERSGFDWTLPAVDFQAPPRATTNAAGRHLFNTAVAQRYGYREAPPTDPNAAAQVAFNTRELSPAEQKALRRCRNVARRKLPAAQEVSDILGSFAAAAYEAAKADKGTLERAAKWRACMRPQGISDLPETPTKMPPDSLERRFGLLEGNSLSQRPATPAEVKIATADARCRESSRYTAYFYDVEFDKQLDAVEKNQDTLKRVRSTISRHDRAARAIVTQSRG